MSVPRASLRLYGPVGPDVFGDGDCITAKGVAADLERLKADGAKALDIYLSSDGGNVTDGLAIYSQIERYPGDVTVHVDGRAVSIASVIALAGARLVMPRASLLMIHSPWAPVVGNAAELRKRAADLEVMSATMRGIYCDASGLPPERVQQIMDEETWLTADEAKALGFADEVTGPAPRSAAPARSALLDSYRNTPATLRQIRAESALARLETLLARQRVQEIARGALAAATRIAGSTPKTTK